MSFFDRQGIPESVLREAARRIKARENAAEGDSPGQVDQDDSKVDDDFEDDITILRGYSFVSFGLGPCDFEMHALVQLATRAWLGAHVVSPGYKLYTTLLHFFNHIQQFVKS